MVTLPFIIGRSDCEVQVFIVTAAGDLPMSFQHRSSILSKMSGGEKLVTRNLGKPDLWPPLSSQTHAMRVNGSPMLSSAPFSSRYLRPLDRNAYVFRGLKRRFRDITQAVSWLEQAKDRMQRALMWLPQKVPPPPHAFRTVFPLDRIQRVLRTISSDI
jgi:hypothetical protein